VKYLDLIKSKLNINEDELGEIKDDLEYVDKVLKKYDIVFDDVFAISFYNHIIQFIKRAKTGKFIDPIEKEMVSELNENSIRIGTELLSEVFNRYKADVNISEIYLISIHIQVAMNNKQ